jgi:antitoxin ParD1/3/4/toxin ParE1/3/4
VSRALFAVSPQALEDLDEIWLFIARDDVGAADRFERRIREAFYRLARNPGIGPKREDITGKPVLFWPVGSYLIIYAPSRRPIEIVRVLHGAREVRRILAGH